MIRRGAPVRIADALADWKREARVARRGRPDEVGAALARVLGDPSTSRARAVSLRRGVLLVEVASAARLHELRNFSHDACRERLNRLLGAPRVRRIDFRLAPSPEEGA